MKLFKNVDIKDLNSILENGIISIDELGFSNWEDNRADNAINVVYLFKSNNEYNSFAHYGVALLEIETDRAQKNEMAENDFGIEKYDEYICTKILPSEIKKIYIPKIFKDRLTVSVNFEVEFCEITAEVFEKWENGEQVYRKATEKEIETFSKTANFEDCESYNFLRGINKDRTMVDFKNFIYKF